MSSFRGLYDIREGKESDKNFVLATFLRGLYHGDSWFSLMPRPVFMDNYKRIAEHLVTTSVIVVACLKDEPDVIIGYSLISKDAKTLHWVYVKGAKLDDGSSWRTKGIARSLIPPTVDTVTHLSALGRDLLPKLKETIFNPFLI